MRKIMDTYFENSKEFYTLERKAFYLLFSVIPALIWKNKNKEISIKNSSDLKKYFLLYEIVKLSREDYGDESINKKIDNYLDSIEKYNEPYTFHEYIKNKLYQLLEKKHFEEIIIYLFKNPFKMRKFHSHKVRIFYGFYKKFDS